MGTYTSLLPPGRDGLPIVRVVATCIIGLYLLPLTQVFDIRGGVEGIDGADRSDSRAAGRLVNPDHGRPGPGSQAAQPERPRLKLASTRAHHRQRGPRIAKVGFRRNQAGATTLS